MSDLISNFKNLYNSENLLSLQTIKSNNDSLEIINLNQADFDNGTYRIKNPGIYKINEDITFSPNSNLFTSNNCDDLQNVLDNFQPTESQFNNEYPPIPYKFGFFAAITIESDNVEIDLNGHLIQQSDIHHVQQRFFSTIELNASPFIKPQGPADFGDITFPKNIYIHNGTIGKSSHHAIHGNGNKNVLIENLIIKDYEVGAIALNGSENVITRNIHITNSLKNVPINFLYSKILFIRKMLLNCLVKDSNQSININGNNVKTITQIVCELQKEMIETVYLPTINKNEITSNIFKNQSLLPEGNIYAFVFNQMGVVVNDFINTTSSAIDKTKGNCNIVIHNIKIENIDAFPREVPTLCDSEGLFVGAVGNVLPILEITDDELKYKGNIATNATLMLAKYVNNNIITKSELGTRSLRIPNYVITDWAETENSLEQIINTNNLKYVNLRDQMAHIMKGNILCFLSGINGCKINNLEMKNIYNNGANCDCDESRKVDYKFIHDTENYPNHNLSITNYIGDNVNALLICGSVNIDVECIYCDNLASLNGSCKSIKYLGQNENVNIGTINMGENDYYSNLNYLLGMKNGKQETYNNLINNLNTLFRNNTRNWLDIIENINNLNKNEKKLIKKINDKIISLNNKRLLL